MPYDYGYQGIIGVYKMPDSALRLITVARSSEILVYDPILKKVNLVDQVAKKTLLIQPSVPYEIVPGTSAQMRQFAGHVYVDKEERFAYVARPFSDDVVIVDLIGFHVFKTISVAGQPLDVVCIGQKLFTRGWKTDELSITHI